MRRWRPAAPSRCGSATRRRNAKRESAIASGQAVAGNVGAKSDSNTPSSVNRSTRPRGSAELARVHARPPAGVIATVQNASENERDHWTFGDTVTLRGHDEPTRLALPVLRGLSARSRSCRGRAAAAAAAALPSGLASELPADVAEATGAPS